MALEHGHVGYKSLRQRVQVIVLIVNITGTGMMGVPLELGQARAHSSISVAADPGERDDAHDNDIKAIFPREKKTLHLLT